MFGIFKRKKDLTPQEMVELQESILMCIEQTLTEEKGKIVKLEQYDLLYRLDRYEDYLQFSIYQLSRCKTLMGEVAELHSPPLFVIERNIYDIHDYQDDGEEMDIKKLKHTSIQVLYYLAALVRSLKGASEYVLTKEEKEIKVFVKQFDRLIEQLDHFTQKKTVTELEKMRKKLLKFMNDCHDKGVIRETPTWSQFLGMVSLTYFHLGMNLKNSQTIMDYATKAAETFPDVRNIEFLQACDELWKEARYNDKDEDGSYVFFTSFNLIDHVYNQNLDFEERYLRALTY